MAKIGKVADIFYEIDGNEINLTAVSSYANCPNVCVQKRIYTDKDEFWGMVYEALIETKGEYEKKIENADGDFIQDQINRFKIRLEQLSAAEKAIGIFIGKGSIDTIGQLREKYAELLI